MKIGIYTNTLKDKDLKVTKALIKKLNEKNIEYFLDSGLDSLSGNSFDIIQLIKKIDILLVVGGDGTILNVVVDCAVNNVPVLGINVGRIGFLTEAETDDIEAMTDALIKNEYSVEKRFLLQSKYNNKYSYALNEVMIARTGDFRVINFDIKIGENLIDSYAADGFIISSPTGSTAYSLSCGGPILSPLLEAIVLTPINPHSLHSRAIVVSDKETASLRLQDARAGAGIVTDGKFVANINHNEEVTVSRSDIYVSFIRFKKQNFYSRLFDKLDIWSTRK